MLRAWPAGTRIQPAPARVSSAAQRSAPTPATRWLVVLAPISFDRSARAHRCGLGGAFSPALGVALLSFLGAVGLALDTNDLGAVHQAADGAYDGEPTYQTITTHDSAIAVVIPPQENAVPSAGFETDPSPRDIHLLTIASLGRLGWQEVSGYGKRALVETAMGR